MVQGPPDSTTSLLQRLQGRRRSERSAEVRAGALTRHGLCTRAIEDHHGEVSQLVGLIRRAAAVDGRVATEQLAVRRIARLRGGEFVRADVELRAEAGGG